MNQKSPSLVAGLLASFALGALGASLAIFLCTPGPDDYFSVVTALSTTSIAWKLCRL